LIRPKRHHYVTKAYLDGFLEKNEEQLFCLLRHRLTSFRSLPEKIAFERNYYAFKNKDGSWNDGAERFFAEKIEEPGLPILKKLAAGRTRINWSERNNLAMLLAVQEFRVPFYRREFSRLHQELTRNIVEAYEAITDRRGLTGYVKMQAGPEPVRVSIDVLKAELKESADFSKKKELAVLFSTAMSLAEIYLHMKWTVHYATGEKSFVASDCPVFSIYSSNKGFAALMRTDVEVRFPLARNALLTLTHDMPFLEMAAKASTKEAKKMWARTPEVRIDNWTDQDVAKANRTHAAHSTTLLLSGQDLSWATEIMKEPSRNVRMWIEPEGEGYRTKTEIRYTPE